MIDGERKLDWILYFNRSSNWTRREVVIFLEGLEGIMMDHSLHFDFQTTTNLAKYEALIDGLKLARDIGVKSLVAQSNSQLIISQVNGPYETRLPCLNKYIRKVKRPLEKFDHFETDKIPQFEKDHTDALAKLASMRMPNENWLVI